MKSRFVISILVLAAILLAACAPAATPTAAPAAPTTAPAAAEATATTAPAAAEPTATTAAAAPAAGGDTIKIAILAPLSGPVPTFGVSTRDGALFAIDEWNAKGGVLGKKIEAVVADSQCTPDPAVNAANKVIDQDGVHYIIGEVCSKASIPVSEIAEAKHVVQISPTSTNSTVTLNADGSTKQYVFRACFIDPFQGLVMAKFALSKSIKTAFIMYDKGNDYTVGLAEAFEKSFTEAGGKVVGKETYTGTDQDFSAILTKVAESKAEMVFLPDYYQVVNLVTAQAKEKGITATFMGGDGWDSSDLDLKAADGGYYSNHYSPEDKRDIVQNWVTNYKAKYNAVPDALATLAYDATNILISSIQTAGKDDASAVKDAVAAVKWEGVSGTITYDKQHNPIKSAAVLSVKDGKIVFDTSVAP
jgi:branched-chain amino acid transport system substrate-binding protein